MRKTSCDTVGCARHQILFLLICLKAFICVPFALVRTADENVFCAFSFGDVGDFDVHSDISACVWAAVQVSSASVPQDETFV